MTLIIMLFGVLLCASVAPPTLILAGGSGYKRVLLFSPGGLDPLFKCDFSSAALCKHIISPFSVEFVNVGSLGLYLLSFGHFKSITYLLTFCQL